MATKMADETSSETASSVPPCSSINVLSFRETFNFKSYVKENLMDNSIYGSFDYDETIASSSKIIGQERNSNILVAWDAPIDGASSKIVTHVGIYSPLSPTHRTLYTHNDQIDICGGTVDTDKTLLAFTIRERQPNGLYYDTYVAEICPCNRVFSLNLNSTDFRKLQFVHNKTKPPTTTSYAKSKLTSRLLVIIPDNWICLYSFQLEPIDRGFTVVNQPSRSLVVNDLSWYQWDPQNQWLSYAGFGGPQSTTLPGHRPHPDSIDSIQAIHVVDFSSRTQSIVITFSVSLPRIRNDYISLSSYNANSLAFSLPVHELNMKLLHNIEGLWCLCIQNTDGTAPPKPQKLTHESRSREVKIEYSVYILHNGHIIEGDVILPAPVSEGYFIQFLLLRNFVVAYVPQVMLHILNVGAQTDPCHHLILDKQYSPPIPVPEAQKNLVKTRHVLEDAVARDFDVDGSYTVLDPQTSIFYTFSINPKAMLDLFVSTDDLWLKESLIHLSLVGLREYTYAFHMIEHICQTPLTLEDPRLFQEFLLALSYSCIYPHCLKFFARHLPLTNALCYRGNIYKNSDHRKYALLRCNEMPDFYKQLLVQSDQKLVSALPDFVMNFRPNPTDPLQDLCYSAVLNQSRVYRRLNLMDISSQVAALAMSTPSTGRKTSSKKGEKRSDSFSRSGNFVDRIKDLLHSPKANDSHSTLSSNLPFLLPDEDLNETITIRSDLYRGRMMQIISTQLMLQSKNNQAQLHTVMKLYLTELEKASRILLHIIWNSLSFSSENHPLQASLHRQPSLEEEILFELLESYHLVHLDIGLQAPTGFMTLFICIGYLCLEPSVFVNYLRNGVFTPTKIFLNLLLSDCEGVDDDFLYEILSHVDEDTRMVAMKRWKHPVLDLWLTKLPPPKQSSN